MRQISILSGLSTQAEKVIIDEINNLFGTRNGFLNYLVETGKEIWSNSAISENPSWGRMYASTLRTNVSSSVGSVYADESHPMFKFVNMMEDGVKPWSIRDALLSSKKAKRSSDGGRYIIVPFRWKTPTMKGGAKVKSSFSGVIPGNVYDVVKKGGKVAGMGNLSGLTRYGKKGHSKFFTFRMVSDKTPSSKWRHPGSPPTPVFDDVYPIIVDMINRSLENIGKGIGGNLG